MNSRRTFHLKRRSFLQDTPRHFRNLNRALSSCTLQRNASVRRHYFPHSELALSARNHWGNIPLLHSSIDAMTIGPPTWTNMGIIAINLAKHHGVWVKFAATGELSLFPCAPCGPYSISGRVHRISYRGRLISIATHTIAVSIVPPPPRTGCRFSELSLNRKTSTGIVPKTKKKNFGQRSTRLSYHSSRG
jgi:hypothetical protein